MIGYLRGQPTPMNDYLLLYTPGGIGFKVFVGAKILAHAQVSELELYIYSHIREDRFELYGFATSQDQHLFELLLGVSGCGPKLALTLTDAGAPAVVEAIQQADVAYFTQFPRVGKKLAQKLIIELKNKLGGLQDLDLSPKSETYEEVMAGLQVLGFSEPDIRSLLKDLDLANLDTATAIKQALQRLKR